MLAIKGASDSFLPGGRLQIFREHGRPGDGLESEPMRSGCREHGKDHQDISKLAEHRANYRREEGIRQWILAG